MEILKHRINSYHEIEPSIGLEIDVRDFNNELVLSHDHPTFESIKFNDFLKNISKNQLLAINIKSTEIENEIKESLETAKITHYFTFDWAIPSLIKALNRELVCAFRLSEYEQEIFSQCNWVWIDTFQSIWFDAEYLASLKNLGFKIALVSPELHNRKVEMKQVKEIVNSVKVDAICTDLPDYWYT
jgi:hypothetical protein